MFRVLLITYYWPPSGGGGVQRWLKFSKYLRDYGVEPVIYTPFNPDYPALDESLSSEVPPGAEHWRLPIWEPYRLYRKFTGKSPDTKIYSGFISDNPHESLAQKISVFIRGNFFIPDARKFWIRPSIRYLTKKLQESPVDMIISTGPPHSMHLIASGIAQRTRIPWIADFRDPWTGIDFYHKLRLTWLADRIHHSYERRVLRQANAVVTVSPNCVDQLEALSGREVHLITNGYDKTDFAEDVSLSEEFSLTHIGSINPDRNPDALWSAVDTLLERKRGLSDHLKINIVGPMDQSVASSIARYPNVIKHVNFVGWVEHKEAIRRMQASQVLLLLLNDTPHTKGILSGKLFEYLGARRPILCIGASDGDAAFLIEKHRAGMVADFTDRDKMISALSQYFDQYLTGRLETQADKSQISQYARHNLVSRYAQLMKSIAGAEPSQKLNARNEL